MTLNRTKHHIDAILRIIQNSFRKKRSTISHILALRRMIKDRNIPSKLYCS